MTWPFDPRSWLPQPPPETGRAPSLLQTWMELTSWWVDPMVAVTQSIARAPDQALSQLVNGLALAYTGRRVDLHVHGRQLSASLDALHLFPGTGGDAGNAGNKALIELSDVEVHGLRFDQVSMVARRVVLRPGVDPRLAAEGIDVRATLPVDAVVRWADPQLSGWSLRVDPKGDLLGRRAGRGPELVLDVRAADGIVHLEVRAVRWRGWRWRLPRWLCLERRIPVELGRGLAVVDATRRGDDVGVHLVCERFDQPLDLRRLRTAVIGGTGLRL